MLEGLAREPYTCERLNSISGGYRQLSGACPALTIDFTNPLVRNTYQLANLMHVCESPK